MSVEDVQDWLGCRFASEALLQRALTHPSWSNEHPGKGHNEKLAVLGDAFLDTVLLEHVLPSAGDKGEMDNWRQARASNQAWVRRVADSPIPEALRLGEGQRALGLESSMLATAFEAVIGALVVDQGWPEARRVARRLLGL